MATILINDQIRDNMLSGFNAWGWSTAWGGSSTYYILQGSVPDQATLDGYTDPVSERSGDILITINQGGGFSQTSVVNNTGNSNPTYVRNRNWANSVATQTGTATWFWIHYVSSGRDYNTIGTVGVPGSGADLLVNSTSIISGNSYRIDDMRITVPNSFTY